MTNVEKLLSIQGVVKGHPQQVVENNLLNLVKEELDIWVEERMGNSPYVFGLILPNTTSLPDKTKNIETVMKSFGIFSVNLWEILINDKDNPVFKVVQYFHNCVVEMQELKESGVVFNDVFGVQYYNFVYGLSVEEVI